MDQEQSSEQRLRPRRAKRWKVALALVGMTATSMAMAGEASAAVVSSPCKPPATEISTVARAAGCGVSTLGVRW